MLVAALDLNVRVRRSAQDLATVVALLGHPGRVELGGGVGLVVVGSVRIALDRRGGHVGAGWRFWSAGALGLARVSPLRHGGQVKRGLQSPWSWSTGGQRSRLGSIVGASDDVSFVGLRRPGPLSPKREVLGGTLVGAVVGLDLFSRTTCPSSVPLRG